MMMGKHPQTQISKTPKMSFKAVSLKAVMMALMLSCTGALLSGCAFKPLYGTTATNAQLQDTLKSVSIPEVPGRVGQVVRNELIFRFTGGGHADAPQYRLSLAVRESVKSQFVRRDGDSAGQFLVLNTSFKLYRVGDDKSPILEGDSVAQASFTDNTSIYSNVRSRRDAEDRAAKTTAEDLQVRISAFLSGNS
jgi:LPS-assembly lipoprotein